ncbi:MAG: GH3 auxin-responsive promoter family protein [Planctomycetota bacterium]
MIGRLAYFHAQYPLVRRLLRDTRRGRSVQREVMREKLRIVADSDFGRDHNVSAIKSVDDFRRQLPISDYEYFRPYIERVCEGDANALFGPDSKVLMFALTSGTTDKQKYIPVTNHFVREYKRGWKIWGLQAHADHKDLLRKDYVHLSSDWQSKQTNGGDWCGSISGLAAETRPAVVRRPFVLPPEVSKIDDWTARQYITLRLALASSRVGMVITANPLTLVSLARLADQEKEKLIKDLVDGTLHSDFALPQQLNPALQSLIQRRHVRRGRELEQVVEQTGHLFPKDAWPDLSLVAVWMGGSAGTFVPEVRELYGNCGFRDHGLSASEGRMTIPMNDESNLGLLDFTTNYFEFIPESEYDNENPTVLESHELQEGESYYILLTTSSGLFRYDIRDVVRCGGFEGDVPLLEFLHKGAHCSSVTGEKLTESQVAKAVGQAFQHIGHPLENVMLVPEIGSPPGYRLLVEPHLVTVGDSLAEAIDVSLAKLNCEYENRLETHRLLPLSVVEVPAGTWNRVRDDKIANHGGSYEQYKHTFLNRRGIEALGGMLAGTNESH